jgi:hypothetical protein
MKSKFTKMEAMVIRGGANGGEGDCTTTFCKTWLLFFSWIIASSQHRLFGHFGPRLEEVYQ